jgi:hypothetical protein
MNVPVNKLKINWSEPTKQWPSFGKRDPNDILLARVVNSKGEELLNPTWIKPNHVTNYFPLDDMNRVFDFDQEKIHKDSFLQWAIIQLDVERYYKIQSLDYSESQIKEIYDNISGIKIPFNIDDFYNAYQYWGTLGFSDINDLVKGYFAHIDSDEAVQEARNTFDNECTWKESDADSFKYMVILSAYQARIAGYRAANIANVSNPLNYL